GGGDLQADGAAVIGAPGRALAMLALLVELEAPALGDGEIGIGAKGDRALARMEAEMAGGGLGQPAGGLPDREAALVDGGGEEQREQGGDAGRAGGACEDVLVVLARERPGAVIGGNEGDEAGAKPSPDRLPLVGANRRVHLPPGAGADRVCL